MNCHTDAFYVADAFELIAFMVLIGFLCWLYRTKK